MPRRKQSYHITCDECRITVHYSAKPPLKGEKYVPTHLVPNSAEWYRAVGDYQAWKCPICKHEQRVYKEKNNE